MSIDTVMIFIFAFVIVVGSIGLWHELRQSALDKEADRWKVTHHYQPDSLGNYPAYFNPESGTYLRPRPGNTAYPVQEHFIVGNSPVQPVEKTRHERPIVMNTGGMRVSNYEPELLAEPEVSPQFRLEEPETFPDFRVLLAQAKSEGRNKKESISVITGVKAGGSKAYADWSKLWDNLS